MAINTNNNQGNAINVSFNTILGSLFLGSDATAVAAEIGKAPKGTSFTGNTGFTADARKALREQGVGLVNSVSGILRDAKLRMIESAGKQYPYLQVRLQDGAETIFVSLNLSVAGAQVLARKLANAKPGVETELSVFSTYQKREGADRAYAETNAYLKQGGEEVKGLSAVDSFVPSVNAAVQKLKDAGIDDSAILNAKRRAVAQEWHADFLENKVAPIYAAAKPASDTSAATPEPTAPAVGTGFDDFENDIPF
jgi:hypothetical protein